MDTISDAFDKKKRENSPPSGKYSLAGEYPALLAGKRDGKKLIVVSALIIGLVLGCGAGFLLFRYLERGSSGKEESSVVQQAPSSFETATKPSRNTRQFPDLKLEGILADPFDPQAIVNGRIIRAGDKVKGARVVAVHDWGVVVEFQGIRKEIRNP